MAKKTFPKVTARLDKIVGGGQALATMDDGRKLFVWGGLPGELVEVQLTKKKSSYAEGIVTEVLEPSDQRQTPKDDESFLSTSPWQIMDFATEQATKAQLINEAFEMHRVTLPGGTAVYSNGQQFGYRNKMEFSWWWDTDTDTLDLAFYRRGSHRKIPVQGSALTSDAINDAAIRLRDILRARGNGGFQLKTALIRSSRDGKTAAQLYVKDPKVALFTDTELHDLGVDSFQLIYSNPQSPASVITEILQSAGVEALEDTILGVPFRYATEGFFQINLPVYEQALRDMAEWVEPNKPTVDLYSGVGSVGLTIGGEDVTLVEVNESAVREMQRNIEALGKTGAKAVLSASEHALDHVHSNATLIVDPPRAGMDKTVVERLLKTAPQRIIYLSCNPVTQARDVALLIEKYKIVMHRGYNFFPRTPHIENLVVLEKN